MKTFIWFSIVSMTVVFAAGYYACVPPSATGPVKDVISSSDLEVQCRQDVHDPAIIHVVVSNVARSAVSLPFPSGGRLDDGMFWGGWHIEITTPTKQLGSQVERGHGGVYGKDIKILRPGESFRFQIDYLSASAGMWSTLSPSGLAKGEVLFTARYSRGDGSDFSWPAKVMPMGHLESNVLKISASPTLIRIPT